MSYAKKIKSKSEYIGNLIFTKDCIKFKTPHVGSTGRINRKHFIALGDVVYFFFLDGKLMKIGKAAGENGWYNRMAEYTKTRFNKNNKDMWDATTRKIYNFMTQNDHTELEVYAIKTPRVKTTIKSCVTGKSYTVEIETAEDTEQILIQEAMRAGEDLPFCRETLKC